MSTYMEYMKFTVDSLVDFFIEFVFNSVTNLSNIFLVEFYANFLVHFSENFVVDLPISKPTS